MRYFFGKEITKLADKDSSIIVICGDMGAKIFKPFIEKHQDRYINIGICEQSMVSIAAGMALQGMKPYICTITPFLIERAFEQIKLDINDMKTNVKLVGYGNYPDQGISHAITMLDNIHPINFFKNITHFKPKTIEELHNNIYDSYENKYPAFFDLEK